MFLKISVFKNLPSAWNFIKKRLSTGIFLSEICEFFENTIFYRRQLGMVEKWDPGTSGTHRTSGTPWTPGNPGTQESPVPQDSMDPRDL